MKHRTLKQLDLIMNIILIMLCMYVAILLWPIALGALIGGLVGCLIDALIKQKNRALRIENWRTVA
jgi:lipoprotein signal peptidase